MLPRRLDALLSGYIVIGALNVLVRPLQISLTDTFTSSYIITAATEDSMDTHKNPEE